MVEHQVDSLARRDQAVDAGLGQPAHRIGKRAGRIDDHPPGDRPFAPGLLVGRDDAVDEPVGPLRHPDDAHVIDQRGPLVGSGLDEIDQQPRIVELAVVVADSAAEAVRTKRWNLLEC